MRGHLSSESIDRYIPGDVRAVLEERFWQTVEEKSTLQAFSGDGSIVAEPSAASDDAGEIEAGSPPAFVYIAVECSLRIQQLGGYRDTAVPPWIPVGVTGVVRRAERNSTVVAAESGDVLMIPGELFAREWFRRYEQAELADVLADVAS